MKHHLALSALALLAATSMVSCARRQPPPTQHYYHSTNTTYYRERPTTTTTYRYPKSAGVSGGSYSSSPEGFQAITPPSSYSQ